MTTYKLILVMFLLTKYSFEINKEKEIIRFERYNYMVIIYLIYWRSLLVNKKYN